MATEEELARSIQHKLEHRVPRSEWTEEERQWHKEEKKRAKEAEKAAKAARAADEEATAAATGNVQALAVNVASLRVDDSEGRFGRYELGALAGAGATAAGTSRRWMSLADLAAHRLPESLNVESVWVRGRVQAVRAQGSKMAFVVLREGYATLQVVCTAAPAGASADADAASAVPVPREMVRWVTRSGELSAESIVDVCGRLQPAAVKSCSIADREMVAERMYVVSRAAPVLPFELEDAARPRDDPGAHVHRDTRLDHRVLDLRVPAHQAIMRIQAGVCQLFRECLSSPAMGFTEIHTPKIIGGVSEGGTEVFRLKYFEHDACLAQSPQLYKQMAVCGDMRRVFEIGPVFRAENSNTYRHLAEFVGLDVEMEIREHYHEVMQVLDAVFRYVFQGLEKRYAAELECIQRQYPFVPLRYHRERSVRLTHAEAVRLLHEHGHEMGELDDFSSELEKALGEIVAQRYHTDFYIVDRFPASCRPFYTMPAPDDARYTNSFDVFMRGEEMVSGAQRIHDLAVLEQRAAAKGIDVITLADYLEAFRYGAPPHGGAGIGLERVVMLYLNLGNVRECSLFPRERKRLHP
eukprot:ctg_2165.g428